MMLIKMAFFSLFTHKNKTLLILIILSLSACLTLLGFITYNTFEQNMRSSLTETVSGDILIHNSKQSADIDILEPDKHINPIEDYTLIEEALSDTNEISAYTPLCKGTVMLKNPETGDYSTPISVIGADIDKYMNIFKKMRLIEGKLVPKGENGILVSKSTIEKTVELAVKMAERRNLQKNLKNNNKEASQDDPHKKPNDNEKSLDDEDTVTESPPQDTEALKQRVSDRFKVGNTLKVAGFTVSRSMTVLELTIYGIVDMEGIESISSQNSLIDITTYQKLVGYDAESDILTVTQMKKLEENRKYMLEFEIEDESTGKGAFDESSIEGFFDDMIEEEVIQKGDDIEEEGLTLDLDEYREIDEDLVAEAQNKTGKTDFIVIRLSNPNLITKTVKHLNTLFDEQGIDLKAISYLESSISLGSYISLATIIITMIIFLILVISIIIITNSILMSVIDRTSEIGTMMAIGAKRGFIFRLILSESIFISFITAFIGMSIGLVVCLIITTAGIPANDTITMMLFGGEHLYPSINFASFVYTFVIVFAITVISTIYPLIFSTRLTPLQAMSKV